MLLTERTVTCSRCGTCGEDFGPCVVGRDRYDRLSAHYEVCTAYLQVAGVVKPWPLVYYQIGTDDDA